MSLLALHSFHLFAVVPFFLYVALTRSSMPTALFYSLIVLGSVLIVYHGYKTVVRYMSGSNYWWVNLVHALIVGPLLVYIGVMQKETPRAAYEGLFLITFAALGYHLKGLAEDIAGTTKQ